MAKKTADWLVGDAPGLTLEARLLQEVSTRLLGDNTGLYARYTDKPRLFAGQVMHIGLWRKQIAIAKSVVENRRTVVPAGHAVGKTYLSTALACWWLCTRDEAIVIVLAPTFHQISNVFWRALRKLVKRHNLPGEVYQTPRWEITPHRYAIGLSPRKSSVEDMATLQGYHSPNLLVILDEGPGLPRVMWQAVEGLATGENDRLLALGNPIAQNGPFWDATVSDNWYTVPISCLEHPNVVANYTRIRGGVSRRWVEDMVRDYARPVEAELPGAFEFDGRWYEPSAVFESRVLGRAPAENNTQLISLRWVAAAQMWQADRQGETVVGVDPARYGGDNVTLCRRTGGRVESTEAYRLLTLNPTAELTGWITNRAAGAAKVFIDEIGIGAGLVDMCRQAGLPVIPVGFGRGAQNKKQFANVRAECWWRAREALREGHLSLPQDDRLAGDLTAPRYLFDRQGRVLLEAKDDVRTRLGRSPDYGDALAVTFALPDADTGVADVMAQPSARRESRWRAPLTGGGRRRSGRKWRIR